MQATEREFVSLVSPTAPRNGAGFHPCQGLYHRPKGARPKIAFIATHYNVDFSEHYLGDYMAQRGYGFLGWNTRFRGNEAFFILEHAFRMMDPLDLPEMFQHALTTGRMAFRASQSGTELSYAEAFVAEMVI